VLREVLRTNHVVFTAGLARDSVGRTIVLRFLPSVVEPLTVPLGFGFCYLKSLNLKTGYVFRRTKRPLP